jgi:peptidoglycan hydrolase CwlO-like protein
MSRLGGFLVAGALGLVGCSTTGSSFVTPELLARIPADQMGPVNQAQTELKKAEDEVARTGQALKSSQGEVDVAKKELDVAKAQIDETKAVLSKANFDHNSEEGQRALRQQTLNQAQQNVAQAHVKAANTAVDLGEAQKREAEAAREYALAKVDLTAGEALKASGDPSGKNMNVDSMRAKVDDRLKQLEQVRNDVTKLQTQAELDRNAWQDANQRFNEMRAKSGASSTR